MLNSQNLAKFLRGEPATELEQVLKNGSSTISTVTVMELCHEMASVSPKQILGALDRLGIEIQPLSLELALESVKHRKEHPLEQAILKTIA